jgi:phycobilisome core linker protein
VVRNFQAIFAKRSLFFKLNTSSAHSGEISIMRMFKITACVPSQSRIRTQRELQNTYFTKLVPYDNWFREQQRIMKMGGKIVKVELATGKPGTNAGLA